jgi:molecular chaperone GrpE
MSRDEPIDGNGHSTPDDELDAESDFRVEDRRHTSRDPAVLDAEAPPEPARPTIVDEYRDRAAAAERKLQEYIAAFQKHREEQDRVRERLTRDVDRKVELKFAGLVQELLEALDDLDRGLEHAPAGQEAAPLVDGLRLARTRFFAALERHGISRLDLDGTEFDPTRAEALRVDPVDEPDRDGVVTETLRPGYALGERVVRPARVAVGRHAGAGSD